jgi:PAS domain S-box-containing protein
MKLKGVVLHKISHKLLSAFVFISLLIGLICYITLRTYTRINDRHDTISTKSLPLVQHLDDMKLHGVQLISSTTELGYILAETRNHNFKAENQENTEVEQVQQTCIDCHRAYENFTQKVDLSLAKNRNNLQQIQQKGMQLHVLSEQFIEANKRVNNTPAALEAKEKLEEIEIAFLNAVDHALENMKTSFHKDQSQLSVAIAKSYRQVLIIGIAALLLSLLLGTLIARSISIPIVHLTHVTKRFSKGDLAVKIIPDSTSEIGTLQSSFNEMAMRIQTLISQLETEVAQTQKAEELLRQSSRRMTLILETAEEGIMGLDVKGKHTFINPMACQLLGYSTEELLGKHHHEYYHHSQKDGTPYPLKKCPIYSTFKTGRTHHSIEVFWTKDGRHFPVELKCYPILEGNTLYGAVVVFNDITERLKAEQQLIEAKNRAVKSDVLKSAFLANMSHEIRTPMNGILGFASILKYGDPTPEEQDKYVSIIEESGNRMLNIINDIIDLSKIEAGLMGVKLVESSINDQLQYIFTFFKPEASEKGINMALKNTLPANQDVILTDREKLFAILTNLVKNAIKFTLQGSIELACIVSSSHEDGTPSELLFSVKDSGIGIPENKQKAVFDRFIQADVSHKLSSQGTGLGLSITKAYVELLGGKIWVESQVDVGSTFFFTLTNKAEFKVQH